MWNNYYVYVWYLEKTGEPFYVGCSHKTLGYYKRANRNVNKIPKENMLRCERFASKNKYNVSIYKENMSKYEAAMLEQELIKKFGRKGYDEHGVLLNVDTSLYGTKPNHTKTKSNKIVKNKRKTKQYDSQYRIGVLGNIDVKKSKTIIIDKDGNKKIV